ncbi:hypothetical protein NP493_772g02036 [Ridgeia piscesae]|uniref:Nucleolar protein,Nop52 n=1 Tax=Ridgeia piscesae TaxID=27915 RepID=A0AAD9NNH0_RIDPI|nr:hypothetical protein NP493_772g02036 [Ridgeia piscesae]
MAQVAAHVEEDVLIRFAQKLACNEKKVRDRALNKLRKWIENRCKMETGGFTEEDLLKIWKGLHYCVWMSDKPLVQEDLTSNIASLIQCFSNANTSMLFIKTFFRTISREWYGIDRLRLDKFMMLVRRCLASSFVLLKKYSWRQSLVVQFMEVLHTCTLTGHADSIPDGLKFHIVDIFFEELEKVAAGSLGVEEIQPFLDPYCVMLARTTNKSLFGHILKEIFYKIVRQATDKHEDEEPEDDDEAEDADNRLQFDFEAVHKRLFQLASNKRCVARNRAKIYDLVKRLRTTCDGTTMDADISTPLIEMAQPYKNGCEKQKALAGTESNKGKAGKKKKAKVNGLQSEKTKLTKKRKHASLENDENRTLCNGQLDTEVGQTRPKKQKNNMVATQKHTKSSKSQRKNCDVSKTKTENISMHILQRSVGKQLTEPSPFKHTRKDLHRKKLAEDQPRASQQEGTNVSSEKSKKNKKMKKLSGVSASKENDMSLTVNMTQSTEQPQKTMSAFASFNSSNNMSPLTAVFLKRAISKASPKTEPKKKRKEIHSAKMKSHSTGKKKVIFAMAKNTAQEFSDSLTSSPVTPFNPVQKPSQGILKSPASLVGSPATVPPTKLLFALARSSAADFF